MENNISRDERFTRYLLGDLPEEERVRLEEEYFTDDATFERFLTAKDELVDAYVRGELKGQTRERFEEHFLSTHPRRQRVSSAKELIEFATLASKSGSALGREPGDSRWSSILSAWGGQPLAQRFALVAAALVIVFGGVWLFMKRTELQRVERATVTPSPPPEIFSERRPADNSKPQANNGGEATRTPPDNASMPRPIPSPNITTPNPPVLSPTKPTHIASIMLTPVLTRDAGQSNRLLIRPDTSAARLGLVFAGGDYRSYAVVLQTVDGERVWQRAALKGEASIAGTSVVVNIPAKVFRKRDYIITLSGVRAGGTTKVINEYFFSIERENTQ